MVDTGSVVGGLLYQEQLEEARRDYFKGMTNAYIPYAGDGPPIVISKDRPAEAIEKLCKDLGVWYTRTEENKPSLSCIKFEISIKVAK